MIKLVTKLLMKKKGKGKRRVRRKIERDSAKINKLKIWLLRM